MARKITIHAAALVAFFFVGSNLYPADSGHDVNQVEQQWSQAVESNDPDRIGAFLHPDFTFVNPRGQILNRAEHLDDFRNHRTVFTAVELGDLKVRIYGDFAVVTSRPRSRVLRSRRPAKLPLTLSPLDLRIP